MTREETLGAIETMLAYVNGAPIQATERCKVNYVDVTEPRWDWGLFTFRVKPDPYLRPFADGLELNKALGAHGLGVKQKGAPVHGKIVSMDFRYNSVTIQFYRGRKKAYTLAGLLNLFEFNSDGAPCGVEVPPLDIKVNMEEHGGKLYVTAESNGVKRFKGLASVFEKPKQ